jgi:hypothetical protein
MKLEDLARNTYAAYGESVGWKNYQGLPMPRWVELTPEIRAAWRAAADFAYMLGFGGLKVDYPDPGVAEGARA